MAELTVIRVVVEHEDDYIAGTLGDVEWIVTEKEASSGHPVCIISTDSPAALCARLDDDENVCSYEIEPAEAE